MAHRSSQYLLTLVRKHKHTRRTIQQIHSHLIFNAVSHSNPTILTLWNLIIRQYSLSEFPQEAFFLFKHLQQQNQAIRLFFFDSFTYSFLIKACANSEQPKTGKQLHSLTSKSGFGSHVYVQTALVNMYLDCGSLNESKKVFDEMPERNMVTWNALISGFIKWSHLEFAKSLFDAMPEKDVVSWTSIIDGYTRMGRFDEALHLFRKMVVEEGIKPTGVSLLTIFPAIWNIGCLEFCKILHAYGEKTGLNMSDIRVINSLVDAYAKCGDIESARGVFVDISGEKRNLVSWTSIMSGFAMHGMAKEASNSFRRMEREGTRPNEVTFLSVITACSHGGLVDEGLEFFRKMVDDFGLVPNIKHYGSLIDMLGRAGRLDAAEKIVLEIPDEIANVVVWRTLLGACSFHGNIEMGERVTRKIMEMETRYGGDYVLLSNIFAGAGKYAESERVREVMDEQNASKVAGLSLL